MKAEAPDAQATAIAADFIVGVEIERICDAAPSGFLLASGRQDRLTHRP